MTPQAEKLLAEATELELTTTGRASGEPRTVELWFAYAGGDLFFLTGDTHWRRNLEAHPNAEVRLQGRRFPVRWEPAAGDPASKARVLHLFRAKYGDAVVRQWYEGREHTVVALRALP
ncbi:MAG: nitroreductase family deazaflavin-dependent oxidoreductase [Chloroflexi bacterium]|nr:nitroreductase family deazaflavin-dependent oxidoreductase [Chloroflexota bacterium]